MTSYIVRLDMPARAAQQCQPTRFGIRDSERKTCKLTKDQSLNQPFNSNLNLKSSVLMRVETEHSV